jgi:hypothetical protein
VASGVLLAKIALGLRDAAADDSIAAAYAQKLAKQFFGKHGGGLCKIFCAQDHTLTSFAVILSHFTAFGKHVRLNFDKSPKRRKSTLRVLTLRAR